MLTNPATCAQRTVTILIVEDEAIIALALAETLRELGYHVSDIVHSGEDAVARARADNPDVVLMDIVLKGKMDGITAADTLRTDTQIPIIYLSAYSDPATVARATVSGAYGFITKPYQPNQVRATIETSLSKARLERQIRESAYWYSSTLRCVGDAVLACRADGRLAFMNAAAERLLEVSYADLADRPVADVVRFRLPDGGITEPHPLHDALQRGQAFDIAVGTEFEVGAGRRFPIEDSIAPIRGEDGHLLGAVMVFRDVSERLRLEHELRATEALFQNAFELSASGIALLSPDGRVRQANVALAAFLGVQRATLAGRPWSDFLHAEYRAVERGLRTALHHGVPASFQQELRFLRADGSAVWGLTSGAFLQATNGDDPAWFLQILDIDRQKLSEHELAHLALHDPLTGLANRAGLYAEIERAVALAQRHDRRFGVLFVDLDHFKHVNDSLGHAVGDLLLCEIGQRLRSLARGSDMVARMGGDEFIVVSLDVHGADDLRVIADKLRAAIAQPCVLEGYDLNITASVGISVYPDDGTDVALLVRNADSALYHAKSLGRDGVAYYHAEMTARSDRRVRLAGELRRALEGAEFRLHYQPLCPLVGDAPLACEALLRWQRADVLLGPDQFLGAAEDSGLILPIGNWVIEAACAQLAAWRDGGIEPRYVSVNLSARQMRDAGFVGRVADALARHGLPPERLAVELTEDLMFGVANTDLETLEQLRALGVALLIDDFGTGYSSLGYLTRLRPRAIKIDRSFVADMVTNRDNLAIVSATIAMAHRLGLEVIAEGVETHGQLALLRELGCDAMQGYLLSKAVPDDAAARLLRRGRPADW